MSITKIRDQALRLSEEDRANLVGSILDSLDGPDPHDSGADSLTEAKARSEELLSGRVTGIPKEAFLDDVRKSRMSNS